MNEDAAFKALCALGIGAEQVAGVAALLVQVGAGTPIFPELSALAASLKATAADLNAAHAAMDDGTI